MANKEVFAEAATESLTTNNAGGVAYLKDAKQALAQIAATNCFNGTFYANAQNNFEVANEAVEKLKDDPEFISKVAIYSRKKCYMKDMPAFLAVKLINIDTKMFRRTFSKVIDNGKMLQTFVQIALSEKINLSRGTCKHAFRDWFQSHTSEEIFRASVGKPSMRDILRLTHPKPENEEKSTLYAYLKGAKRIEDSLKTYDKEGNVFVNNKGVKYEQLWKNLPEVVKSYEEYKVTKEGDVPNVDFRLLTSLDLGKEEWTQIAKNAPWHMTRMNLNTFQRHGVFEDKSVVGLIADRLRSESEIKKSRVFPYHLLAAYKNSSDDVPAEIKMALQNAMEIAVDNVPEFKGNIVLCPDVSASMGSPVTGHRKGSSSTVRCVDVAALVSACVLRKNPMAQILPFDTGLHLDHDINSKDSIVTNADKLSAFCGGGTDCSLPLKRLNETSANADVVIYISDYESWFEASDDGYWRSGPAMEEQWSEFKKNNLNAKLICIDLTPTRHSQTKNIRMFYKLADFQIKFLKPLTTSLNLETMIVIGCKKLRILSRTQRELH